MPSPPRVTSPAPSPPAGGVTSVPHRPGPVHWLLVLVAAGLFGWFYVWMAGVLVETTNQDPLRQDQKHNMRQALRTRDALKADMSEGISAALRQKMPHLTDGVVAPLWPWVAAHFAAPDHQMPDETFADATTEQDLAFFRRGKWVNVWLTAGFLGLTALFLGRWWSVLGTVNFLVLAGLGAFLPRAVAFQPEPLYFVLFFCAWVLALRMCEKNELGWYSLFGIVCGLAWLTKTSVQPLMAAWFGALGLRFLFAIAPGRLRVVTEQWSGTRHVVGTFMAVATFLVIISPRLAHAQERWGRPFFAYPNVWMWMNDFDTEGYAWMGAHPDRASLDAVPKADMPSFQRYTATHTPEEMRTRLEAGVRETVLDFALPATSGPKGGTAERPWRHLLERRGLLLAGAGLVALVGAAAASFGRRKAHDPSAGPPDRGPTWAVPFCRWSFVLAVVTASALAYGWYHPVGRGDRFMLSLYAPLAFTLLWAGERCLRGLDRSRFSSVCRWTYAGANLALLSVLVWRIHELMQQPWLDPKLR